MKIPVLLSPQGIVFKRVATPRDFCEAKPGELLLLPGVVPGGTDADRAASRYDRAFAGNDAGAVCSVGLIDFWTDGKLLMELDKSYAIGAYATTAQQVYLTMYKPLLNPLSLFRKGELVRLFIRPERFWIYPEADKEFSPPAQQ